VTAQDVIYQALRRIGSLRPGYTAPPELMNDALLEWQAMVDSWNTSQDFQFSNPDTYYPINTTGYKGNSYQYTIGPSGSGADLICPQAARPVSIRRANWVWTITTPTQPQRLPIRLIDESEWYNIIQLPIPGALMAVYMWYDPQEPVGVINLWPPVEPGNQIELYTWGQLTWPSTLSSTVTFAPGYWQATKLSLAEMLIALAPRFEFTKMNPDIARLPALALAARNEIKRVNRVTPRLVSDMRRMQGGTEYNFMIGATTDYS
jgi:hypothetical protein